VVKRCSCLNQKHLTLPVLYMSVVHPKVIMTLYVEAMDTSSLWSTEKISMQHLSSFAGCKIE
jgi:hypothetical protein